MDCLRKSIILVFLGLLALPLSTLATDFSSQNFVVKDPVIKAGAGFSISGGYKIFESIGQEAIGISNSGGFVLKGGFLYFPEPSSGTTPPPPPPPPSFGGGSGPPGAPPTTTPPVKKPPITPPGQKKKICDFNNDKKCNIIDLSILL